MAEFSEKLGHESEALSAWPAHPAGTRRESLRIPLPLEEAMVLTTTVRAVEALITAHSVLLQQVELCAKVALILEAARWDRSRFEDRFFQGQLVGAWEALSPIAPDVRVVVGADQDLEANIKAYDNCIRSGRQHLAPLGNPTQSAKLLEMTDGLFHSFDNMSRIIRDLTIACRRLAISKAREATDVVIEIERIARSMQISTVSELPTSSPGTDARYRSTGAQMVTNAPEKRPDAGTKLTSAGTT
jgi:hypothetical protein